jgi:hypothetical protein
MESRRSLDMTRDAWPDLPLDDWAPTRDTLHLWTQVVGKVRLVQTPWINHSWHCTFYVTSRGLTTSLIPHGQRLFQIDFDFVDHRLLITTVDGDQRTIDLVPKSVATFHGEVLGALDELGLPVTIHPHPAEIADAIPLPEDERHAAYDPEPVRRFWRVLASSERVLQRFRSTFLGKASPVHFFWGSFDLALTLFSGRPAQPIELSMPHMPKWVSRDGSTHEQVAFGFWPGTVTGPMKEPAFYAYAHPAPEGYSQSRVRPDAARFAKEMGEWILPYQTVRKAADPDREILAFFSDVYSAVADLGGWDRAALERTEILPPP